MSGTSGVYNSHKVDLGKGTYSLQGATIYGMLVKSTYVPDYDLHTRRSDVTAFECVGTNYVAGGAALTGKAVTQDNPNDRAVWDATDMTTQWITTTLNGANAPAGLVFYNHRGGAASADELICYFDFGGTKPTTAQDFQALFDSVGIETIGGTPT